MRADDRLEEGVWHCGWCGRERGTVTARSVCGWCAGDRVERAESAKRT